MLAFIESQLTNFLTHFTYFALILVLSLAGLGVPIPEDIPLVFSGYLCSDYSPIVELQREAASEPRMIDSNHDGIPDTINPRYKRVPHVPNFWVMIAAGMTGVLLGDSIVFSIGRRGIDGDNFVARHLRKVLHSKRRQRVERHFARHGDLTVFAGRFAPGFRSIVFAFAGMSKMSYARFLLIDFIAAAISVPTFIWIGYHFADKFDQLTSFLSRTKYIIGPIVFVLLIVAIAFYYVRKRRLATTAIAEST